MYGYLKQDRKDLADRIVCELECDPQISGCYTAWQDAQEQLVQTSIAWPMDHIFLSQRKEFNQIDRKRRREIHEKKLAQGHAWDDREQHYPR